MINYKYIEKVLYSYNTNLEKQREYGDELEYLELHGDLKVQSYSQGTGGGDVPDRVLDYVHRKASLEKKLSRVNMEVWCVGSVLEEIETLKETDPHNEKLYAVLLGVYMLGITEGIDGVADDEVPELRREIVRQVARQMGRYEHIISAS